MFAKLMIHGAALAERAARRRRGAVAQALQEELGRKAAVEESAEGVTLTGRGLSRRFALDPAWRWLIQGLGR
ncbi:MAG TPA: hypothetical protein VHM92_09190 [Allosphingosinicella sp.]|nr:hypothetical protein [Allosphingosinicella sp.]